MNEFEYKPTWAKRHAMFTVEVTRHQVEVHEGDPQGPNRWCVYVHIYPQHPLFSIVYQNEKPVPYGHIPFHGGCSYSSMSFDRNGQIKSVTLGSDYNHLHDERFSHFTEQREAWEVFDDAERIFKFLTPEK